MLKPLFDMPSQSILRTYLLIKDLVSLFFDKKEVLVSFVINNIMAGMFHCCVTILLASLWFICTSHRLQTWPWFFVEI